MDKVYGFVARDYDSTLCDNYISLIQTAEGALDEVQFMCERMQELTIKFSNGTNTYSDFKDGRDEILALIEEIIRVRDTTTVPDSTILILNNTNISSSNLSYQINDDGKTGGLTIPLDTLSDRKETIREIREFIDLWNSVQSDEDYDRVRGLIPGSTPEMYTVWIPKIFYIIKLIGKIIAQMDAVQTNVEHIINFSDYIYELKEQSQSIDPEDYVSLEIYNCQVAEAIGSIQQDFAGSRLIELLLKSNHGTSSYNDFLNNFPEMQLCIKLAGELRNHLSPDFDYGVYSALSDENYQSLIDVLNNLKAATENDFKQICEDAIPVVYNYRDIINKGRFVCSTLQSNLERLSLTTIGDEETIRTYTNSFLDDSIVFLNEMIALAGDITPDMSEEQVETILRSYMEFCDSFLEITQYFRVYKNSGILPDNSFNDLIYNGITSQMISDLNDEATRMDNVTKDNALNIAENTLAIVQSIRLNMESTPFVPYPVYERYAPSVEPIFNLLRGEMQSKCLPDPISEEEGTYPIDEYLNYEINMHSYKYNSAEAERFMTNSQAAGGAFGEALDMYQRIYDLLRALLYEPISDRKSSMGLVEIKEGLLPSIKNDLIFESAEGIIINPINDSKYNSMNLYLYWYNTPISTAVNDINGYKPPLNEYTYGYDVYTVSFRKMNNIAVEPLEMILSEFDEATEITDDMLNQAIDIVEKVRDDIRIYKNFINNQVSNIGRLIDFSDNKKEAIDEINSRYGINGDYFGESDMSCWYIDDAYRFNIYDLKRRIREVEPMSKSGTQTKIDIIEYKVEITLLYNLLYLFSTIRTIKYSGMNETHPFTGYKGTKDEFIGNPGLVPGVQNYDVDKFLKSDGTWSRTINNIYYKSTPFDETIYSHLYDNWGDIPHFDIDFRDKYKVEKLTENKTLTLGLKYIEGACDETVVYKNTSANSITLTLPDNLILLRGTTQNINISANQTVIIEFVTYDEETITAEIKN